MKEIEILIEVKDSKERVFDALSQFEARGVKETLDVYFYDPLRIDLQPNKEGCLQSCFRVRQKAGESLVAYKIDHFNEGVWSHSDEFETRVEDFTVMGKIIEQLGLRELIRIDNKKYTFLTDEYEIVLEDVVELGLFMEVEKLEQVSDDKVLETKEGIRTFLKSLNIKFGDEQSAGKPELMLRKKGGRYS